MSTIEGPNPERWETMAMDLRAEAERVNAEIADIQEQQIAWRRDRVTNALAAASELDALAKMQRPLVKRGDVTLNVQTAGPGYTGPLSPEEAADSLAHTTQEGVQPDMRDEFS